MPSFTTIHQTTLIKIDKNDQLDQKQLAIPQYNQPLSLVGS